MSNVTNEKTKNYKIWTSTGPAGVMVTPEETFMIANDKNFIGVTPNGICLTGPVSRLSLGEQTRMAGMWVGKNDFLSMIPQTIVTPLPSQLPFPPIAFPLAILAGLPFFIAMLM